MHANVAELLRQCDQQRRLTISTGAMSKHQRITIGDRREEGTVKALVELMKMKGLESYL